MLARSRVGAPRALQAPLTALGGASGFLTGWRAGALRAELLRAVALRTGDLRTADARLALAARAFFTERLFMLEL